MKTIVEIKLGTVDGTNVPATICVTDENGDMLVMPWTVVVTSGESITVVVP